MACIDDFQYVYINSADRLSGSDADFTYSINLDPNNEFDHVTVKQIAVPKSYYSVSSGYNYFTLTELGFSIKVIIPAANYNRVSLALVIASQLNAASVSLGHGWTYVVSYPNANTVGDTGFYTYTVSGNTGQPTFTFDPINGITFCHKHCNWIINTH